MLWEGHTPSHFPLPREEHTSHHFALREPENSIELMSRIAQTYILELSDTVV